MSGHYILDGHEIKAVDFATHDRWIHRARKSGKNRLALTILSGGTEVSTVFLGIDHRRDGRPPRVFETMAFTTKELLGPWRTPTWDEALEIHASVVARLERGEL